MKFKFSFTYKKYLKGRQIPIPNLHWKFPPMPFYISMLLCDIKVIITAQVKSHLVFLFIKHALVLNKQL